jgi:GH24 family phage-related lysozyme (muramidase)
MSMVASRQPGPIGLYDSFDEHVNDRRHISDVPPVRGGYARPGPIGVSCERHAFVPMGLALRSQPASAGPSEVDPGEIDYDELLAEMTVFEGNLPHMYLDTKGLITVGIGNMLPNAEAAARLPFYNATANRAATRDEILEMFAAVSKMEKGRPAAKYARTPRIELGAEFRSALAIKRLEREFIPELRKLFPEFDAYPARVRAALIDMSYNLGTQRLRTQFKRFHAAITARNWGAAAVECHRNGVQDSRNDWTRRAFEAAAAGAPIAR